MLPRKIVLPFIPHVGIKHLCFEKEKNAPVFEQKELPFSSLFSPGPALPHLPAACLQHTYISRAYYLSRSHNSARNASWSVPHAYMWEEGERAPTVTKAALLHCVLGAWDEDGDGKPLDQRQEPALVLSIGQLFVLIDPANRSAQRPEK